MNIKTSIYAIFLCAFAVLECSDTDLEQLRAELIETTNQLKRLGEEIQKQEALYEQAKKRFIELRDFILEKRRTQNSTDEQMRSEFSKEMHAFLNTYFTSVDITNSLANNEFFGDFAEGIFLRFYILKSIIEFDSFEKLIKQWDKCFREKYLLEEKLSEAESVK